MWTTKSIKSFQANPPAKPTRIFEGGNTTGFCAQLSPGGTLAPYLQYTIPGSTRKLFPVGVRLPVGASDKVIGGWLKTSRRSAEDARELVDAGICPKGKQAELDRLNAVGTVNQLLDVYLDNLQGRQSHDRSKGDLERDVRPHIGKQRGNSLTASDVAQVLSKVRRRAQAKGHKGDAMVRRIRVQLRKAYEIGRTFDVDETMAAKYPGLQFHIRGNPVDDTPSVKDGKPRTRDLSPEEIQKVWKALPKMVDVRTRMIIKLLLLTGWRRSTICGLQWDEVGDDLIHILPSAIGRNKTGIDLRMPITDDIRKVLDEARQLFPSSESHLFPNSEQRKLSHYSPSRINDEIRHRLCKLAKVDHFSPHDLRRTVVTQMRRAKIDGEIRRRIVGHSVRRDIHDDYDQEEWSDFVTPATIGLQKWHTVLNRIVDPEPPTPIRQGAAS